MRSLAIKSAVVLLLMVPPWPPVARQTRAAGQDREHVRQSPAETFADADSLQCWSFNNGPEWPGARGSLEWRPAAGRVGDGAAALSYNFEDGGSYVAAIVKLPEEREVKAVRLWVRKPAANLMVFRATDADGETFQKNLRYHFPGWQQLEISLTGWEHSWGGDGTFRAPPREFHILIANDGGNTVGTVFLDDVQWVFEPAPDREVAPARTTYIESDFTDVARWRCDEAAGGSFSEGTWNYRFTPEQSRTRLQRDRSLLGRPQKMMLTVESDGSGHELVAWVGSHFQNFERRLGTLSEEGCTTFEAPLGDMKTWRHFGGENDGIVRYPLRLLGLGLRSKAEREQGKLRLVRVEIDTEYDRDNEAVWVIPRVSDGEADTARFTVEVRSLREKPLGGNLHWSLHALDRRLQSGSQALELPARGVPVTTRIEVDWADGGVLEGRFRFRADGVESPEVSTTIASVPPGEVDRTLNPASRMGAGMYLYRLRGQPDAKEWMERMCDLAARAGIKWTREEFHWSWIEPRRREYDFAFFDQLVETARAHGISVYALCCYWTSWTKPYSEQGIEDYCRYLETLVRRYGDRIKHWEIWNEPNIFFWSGPTELYVKLLRRAHETVKRVDPDAQVLGCSTAGIDTNFIEMVLEADGPFDALTVHPYRGTLDPHGFIAELRAVRELAGGRDVWITEMGWPSQIGGLSEREQAQHVARTYISALASGAARSVAWYDFREDGFDPFYNEHHFGLVRRDLTPKMGYLALATVGRLLGQAEFEKVLPLPARIPPDGPGVLPAPDGEGLVGLLFREAKRRVAAIWSPSRTRMATFELKGENVQVLNAVGEPVPGLPDGRVVTVLERNMPIYFLADGELEIDWREFPVAIRLDRPAVHPGETITYDMSVDASVARFEVDELPPGWTSGHVSEGGPITLTVPADAAPRRYTVTHRVEAKLAGIMFTLPVEIEVVPLLLRR